MAPYLKVVLNLYAKRMPPEAPPGIRSETWVIPDVEPGKLPWQQIAFVVVKDLLEFDINTVDQPTPAAVINQQLAELIEALQGLKVNEVLTLGGLPFQELKP